MGINRRNFLTAGGLSLAGSQLSAIASPSALSGKQVAAVAFDAFPIFDPRPLAALAEKLFPGRGTEFMNTWRTRQFEYTWLRSLTRNYSDFLSTTRDALIYAAKALRIDISAEQERALMGQYFQLPVWPDVVPSLRALRAAGIKLVFLSNFTEEMMVRNCKHNGIDGLFDEFFSADLVRSYKPDPAVYEVAVKRLKLAKEQIVFTAFAGWDASSAAQYGYPTVWVNRAGATPEELPGLANAQGRDLRALLEFVEISAEAIWQQ
jgi:2-haloacid dehalogenase